MPPDCKPSINPLNNLSVIKHISAACLQYSSAYKLNPLNCVYILTIGSMHTELSIYSLNYINVEDSKKLNGVDKSLDFRLKTPELLKLDYKDSADFVFGIHSTGGHHSTSKTRDILFKAVMFVNEVVSGKNISDRNYLENKYGSFAVFPSDIGVSSVQMFYYPTMSALDAENLIYNR